MVRIFLTVVQLANAEFTPHFRKFLHDSYGVNMAGSLERTDLGLDASLGGMVGLQKFILTVHP